MAETVVTEMEGLSSYARLFIGFIPVFSDEVVKTSRQKSTKQTPILPITFLSEDQVAQSLADPHNQSFKTLLGTAYVESIKADRAIILTITQIGQQKTFIEAALVTLGNKKKRAPQSVREGIESAEAILNNQYKLLNNISNAADHQRKKIMELQDEFQGVAQANSQEWVGFRDTYLNKIYTEINEVLAREGLPALTKGETDNLKRPDAWQEVIDRFNDTGSRKELSAADKDRVLGLTKPTYDTPFRIRAYIAIRSVLPSHEGVLPYMRRLEKTFKAAQEEGANLTERQEIKIKVITEDKAQPITKIVSSNVHTLEALPKEREDILRKTVTTQEAAAIQEKIQTQLAEPTSGQGPGRT